MSDAALLVENVRRSLAGTYDVLGVIGTDASGAQVLLGRDTVTSALVGISVMVGATNAVQSAPDIQRTLPRTVHVEGSMCPECRTPLPELDAFCFHCGANLSGSTAPVGSAESAIVLQALASATAERYEVLGRLDREGSTSAVYFARDLVSDSLANNHVTALRLTRVDATEASRPEYVQKLTQIFDTGELQANAAKRNAQRAESERVEAERVAAERAATERAAVERAAVERAAVERAAVERAAAERAAAERAAAERAAAERAETERIAAERAAAQSASYARPPIPEFSLEQSAASTPVLPPLAQYHATQHADDSAPPVKTPPGSKRTPLIAVGVVAVLAAVGYFAFGRGGATTNTSTVAASSAISDSSKPPVSAPPQTDTAPPVTAAPDAALLAPTAAANTTTPAVVATDSGTIRIADIPADARVTVDGRSMRGRTLRVTARGHQLTVTAKGFEPFSEKLNIAAGATVRWAPKLVAVVAATTSNNVAPSIAPTNTALNAGTGKKSCRELVRIEDWSVAHDVCTTEANAGNAFASASLGRMYAKGQGVTRDVGESITWYKKAAAAGDHDAQTSMGFALREGNGVKRDEKASTEMFRLAAEAGDKFAQLEYAVALEKGDGTNKNQAAARDWYKKAADQGVFMAARRLGRLFEKGDGGPKSEPEALAAYEKAATLGDAESAMTAGKWYRDGHGVAQSPAQALTWFKKALELGNKDAQNEIKKLQK